MRGRDIEFLLVQSRGGRWIFPKGSVEAGLSPAQSAALEAFEEAGVRGRIETISFARYIRHERGGVRRSKGAADEQGTPVHAYLCEVREQAAPREANRNPTWLSPEKAKRRLQRNRAPEFGNELAQLVERAVSRIRRLESRGALSARKDALQRVHMEAREQIGALSGIREAAFARYFSVKARAASSAALRPPFASDRLRPPQLRLVAAPRPATKDK